MKSRIFSAFLAFFVALAAVAEGRAKYVFYFIGDGMGVNQVNGTETYLAALEGVIGVKPLLFGSFPVAGFVTTFSATNGVTDSAAAGTALATGQKTKNSALGLKADLTTPVTSVAQWAKDAGALVGITTSVSVDHATPAAFYAHQPKRGMYHEIGRDLVASSFDFFAGSDFRIPLNKDDASEPSLFEQCKSAGFTVVRGYKEFQKKRRGAERMILLQPENPSNGDKTCLPYAIDRKPSDLTLPQITRAAVSFLTQKAGKLEPFFLMVEGGKIDYACHSNDAAPAFKETIDMDEAIRVAYEFYEQHPDETLIVITADHETGGIVLGRGPYELHTDLLRFQKMSAEEYNRYLERQHKKLGEKFTWEWLLADLKANWGFGAGIELSERQTERLKNAFTAFTAGRDKAETNLYASLGGIASTARQIMSESALIGWQSGGHSNGYVPVFAIGAGSECFNGKMDNTEIPVRIARCAGYTVPEQ